MLLYIPLEKNLFNSSYASNPKKIIIELHIMVLNMIVSDKVVGKKIAHTIVISIQIDITLAIPLGSSFQPNDLMIELSQNFIN